MEQRPLRLGDIVDDYCPRERRITNHAIVAVVGPTIKQTRCTTCDAEHAYKDAKVPRRRKKDDPEALYDEVLTDLSGGQLVGKTDQRPTEPAPVSASANSSTPASKDTRAPASEPSAPAEEPASDSSQDHWPAHRTLIRATLPKVEGGEPPPRPIPEFTMHQRQGRGGQGFRYGGWSNGNGNSNGNSNSGGHGRNGFRGGGRHGGGHGQGQGQGHPGGGGGRHRHRGGGKHRQPK
jgi:hypothetical protein